MRTALGGLAIRLMRGGPGPRPNGLTDQEVDDAHWINSPTEGGLCERRGISLWVNGELARATRNYADLPMVVLSAGIQDQEEDPQLVHDHVLKLELHEKLAQRSIRGVHTVVPESGHDIPDEAPPAMIAAIRQVIKESGHRRRTNASEMPHGFPPR
jgi:hypothetical protein